MTERRYPPGDVGPARMLAGRPGLNARHGTRVVMCSVCSGRTERRYQPGKIRLVRMLAGRPGLMSSRYARSYSSTGLGVWDARAQVHRRRGV